MPAKSNNSHKRAASTTATPTRQSKRTRATPAKGSYIEQESEDDLEQPKDSPSDDGSDVTNASDFEALNDQSSESEHEEDMSSEEDTKPAKSTPNNRGKKQMLPMHKKHASEKDLWKPGAKLVPGTTVVIKKPKAREAGSTPYSDGTIHPNTLLFLKDLAGNNDRDWLKMHDPDYRQALQDWNSFLEKLTEEIVDIDTTIPELPVKDIVFRIYRDIRFSKDPTPYKTHLSAAWSRTGRKGPYAAYYVQIKPGGSFVGGGLWCPEAQPLSLLRQAVDRKPQGIKRVLNDAGIRKEFFGGIASDEKKAVRAFTNQSGNKSNALKKHPKGYTGDHKDIELLRLRNFTLGTKLSDDEVVGPRGLERIADLIRCLVPFVTYLNSVVMPDEEPSSDDDEAGGESDDGDTEDGSAAGRDS